MAPQDRARHHEAPAVATPTPARPAASARQPPLAALHAAAGNQAVAQLVGGSHGDLPVQRFPTGVAAPPPRAIVPTVTDVDPRARVDLIQRAIGMNLVARRFDISMDMMIEALTDLTPEVARAVRAEYRRRTTFDLRWVLTGQQQLGDDEDAVLGTSLGKLEQKRLLNLAEGTAVAPLDPERAIAAGETFGALAAGAARLLGQDDIADELGDKAAAYAASQVAEQQGRELAVAEANRYRGEAATIRRHIERQEGEQAIAMVRRPDAERQALATQYRLLFGSQLYVDLTSKLRGDHAARAAATWIEDYVTADRIALEADLAAQRGADASAAILESAGANSLLGPSAADMAARELGKRQRLAARAKVEARLAGIAAAGEQDAADHAPVEGADVPVGRESGRAHLAKVLDQEGATPGATLRSQLGSQGDKVARAIAVDDEVQELAARLARSDIEGTLKVADLEAALRHIPRVARRMVVEKVTRQPDLAPFAEQLLIATTAAAYDTFRKRFDADDTRRTLDKALDIGGAVEEERNRALLGANGQLPDWRELDLALRRSPKDMPRVRAVLGRKDRPTIVAIAKEYEANTRRSLETDLLGTEQEQAIARFRDKDEASQEHMERLVLLGGGRFHSDALDEAARLEEERRWLGARTFALKRAVIQNRGTFAKARDWMGNIEKELVERADTDITNANIAASRALTESPPDLGAAREALAEMRRAGQRVERNLDVYKEATKAAFDEFVDLAVLAVTTIVTLGEGTVVIMAIRATMATVGTKLVLKGDDYSLDEFLMDLRSGLGSAAGGKLAEGVLKPIATKVAGYAARSGLSTGLTGKVSGYAGKAAMWEGEQVITTGVTNIATGQDLGAGLGATDQGKALLQHGVTTGLKSIRGGSRTQGDGVTTPRVRTGGIDESTGPVAGPHGPDGLPLGPMEGEVDVGGDQPQRVPMALPEDATASGGRRRQAVDDAMHALQDETPTKPGKRRDVGDQTDVDIRTEQARRSAEHPSDRTTIRETTSPDARARDLAERFGPVYDEWHALEPPERLERLERAVRQRLQDAGLPHVWVEFPPREGIVPPGGAAFVKSEFKIYLDEASVRAASTPEQFAEIADSVAHEARHALHIFRGMRAAMAAGRFDPEGYHAGAVAAARDANTGHRPAEPMAEGKPSVRPEDLSPAFAEAYDMYREMNSSRGRARRRRHDRAWKRIERRIARFQAEADRSAPGSDERKRAETRLREAREQRTRLHNEYVSWSHETDAWRAGSAVRTAVTETLATRRIATLHEARRAAIDAQRRAVAKVRHAEAIGADTSAAQAEADAALGRFREANREIRELEQQLRDMADLRQGAEAPESEVWPPHEDFDDPA